MHPAGSKTGLIIIGGGASGLAAACIAVSRSQRVILLEARDRIGRKLLATGNGRCNLLNAGPPIYFGDTSFALQVLERCGAEEVLSFFHGLGLTTVVEERGLCYPACMQAAAVLDVLRRPLERSPLCTIRCGEEVTDIRASSGGFFVNTVQGSRYEAARVLVAAGSPAQPQLSGSDTLYAPLVRLGHRLIPARPALSALLTPREAVRGLKGLRLPAICTLCDEGRPVARTEGEVLFAEDGLSGVCVMQLSRDAGELVLGGRRPLVYLDFSPLLGLAERRYQRSAAGAPGENEARVLAWLTERAQRLPPGEVLTGALPRLLLQRLEGKPMQEQARLLSAFPLAVTGVRGFEHAQVAAGGIDCADVDPYTMESRLVPGLYLAGEVLNVDGDTGGHNLLFAWASGLLAGAAASG